MSLCNASIWHHGVFDAMDGHETLYDGKKVCRHGIALEDSYHEAIIGYPFFLLKKSLRLFILFFFYLISKSVLLVHYLFQALWLPISSSHHGYPLFEQEFKVDHVQALWLTKPEGDIDHIVQTL